MPSPAKFESLPTKGDGDSIYGNSKPAPVQGRTPSQVRWRNGVLFFLIADVVTTVGLYEATHGFSPSWDLAGLGHFGSDTLDLVLLAGLRVAAFSVLVPLTLAVGVDSGPRDKLPHEQTDAELARTVWSAHVRMGLLIAMFLLGAASSVYAGIKCIMFDFASSAYDAGSLETYMAPFLLADIAVVNLQFSCIKRLVKSYVMQARRILGAATGPPLRSSGFLPVPERPGAPQRPQRERARTGRRVGARD
jgi:hypothetical protein